MAAKYESVCIESFEMQKNIYAWKNREIQLKSVFESAGV